MNDNFNNQNNFGYNQLTNGGGQNYYNTTHNNTTIVNTNPNAHKSKSQVLEEIEMLEKKIENNKSKLNNINEETKIMVENIIAEDEMRTNELKHELESRKNKIILLIIYLLICAVFIFFMMQNISNN